MDPSELETLPTHMRAVGVTKPGSADYLTVEEVPVPEPDKGELLIKVTAAGLNRADIAQRDGYYPAPPGASPIMGLEVSGIVAAPGEEVTGWAPGDPVCALLAGGGYAQYCTAPAVTCMPIPKNVSLIEAASLPEAYCTVWSNLFERARLKSGETLLVHGGSSGIGTCAIMLARQFGVIVYTTAGSDDKCAACRRFGADLAINYKLADFAEVVRDHAKTGVDVILDMVGGDYVQKNIKCLAPEGRLVYIGFLGGSKTQVDLMSVMLKRLTLTGSTLRSRELSFKAAIVRKLVDEVWPLFAAQKLRPVIDTVFPMAQVSDAHRRMESSAHIGKILLQIDG